MPFFIQNNGKNGQSIDQWGIYMLIIAPRAFCIQILESKNPDNIDKEAFFKFLVISKDKTLMGRFLIF